MEHQTFKHTVFILKDEMFRFAKRYLSEPDDARDVVQELMMRFWEKRNELERYTCLKSYVLRCVKNECLNRLKHNAVKLNYQNIASNQSVSSQSEFNNLHEQIVQMIEALPQKQKLVLHLRDIEEFSIEEIAETLEMERNAVRVNLARGREKIRQQITQLMHYEKRSLITL